MLAGPCTSLTRSARLMLTAEDGRRCSPASWPTAGFCFNGGSTVAKKKAAKKAPKKAAKKKAKKK
jgi:hypothetical protein